MHVAVTPLKGRAFRAESPDGLREPSEERERGRGDAFTGTGIECGIDDVGVLNVFKDCSIWQKTNREVLRMHYQSSRVFFLYIKWKTLSILFSGEIFCKDKSCITLLSIYKDTSRTLIAAYRRRCNITVTEQYSSGFL